MTQMMRKKGEDHLYRYDPVDFNAEIWEIVDLESSDKPKASKPRKPKPVEPEPIVEEPAVEADPDDEFNFD